MSTTTGHELTGDGPRGEVKAPRERLRVAEETLQAIRNGELDSPIARTSEGPRVFGLADASSPCRSFVEEMQHGAAMLGPDGTVLDCDPMFPRLLPTAGDGEHVLGASWRSFVAEESVQAFEGLLSNAARGKAGTELVLRDAGGTRIPVFLTASPLTVGGVDATCLVVTDLTELKRTEESLRRLPAIVGSTEVDFLRRVVKSIEELWFTIGALPSGTPR